MDEAELILQRAKELQVQGFDWGYAWGIAVLEQRIKNWPTGWGEDFHFLIYGDFEPPSEDLYFPSLGITINHYKKEKTIIKSALCVLEASIKIDDKNLRSIIDATRRINLLLGILTLVEHGNGSFGWWSYITHGTEGAVMVKLGENKHLDAIICLFLKLPEPVRRKVDSALYWVKEPRNLLLEQYRIDILRMYSAYWNAFECLVDAINLINPQKRLSRSEKQRQIDEFLWRLGMNPTSEDIANCYHQIVNNGFRGTASHALKICFPINADLYIKECFEVPVINDRLYKIRNAIDHGDIDAENPEELIRIESRLILLRQIVWEMFAWIIRHASSRQEAAYP
jgi:hypothetical protein